jgi:hypothetical protein
MPKRGVANTNCNTTPKFGITSPDIQISLTYLNIFLNSENSWYFTYNLLSYSLIYNFRKSLKLPIELLCLLPSANLGLVILSIKYRVSASMEQNIAIDNLQNIRWWMLFRLLDVATVVVDAADCWFSDLA